VALTQFARLTTATHTQYVKGFEDETTRSRLLLFGLRKRGKIKYKQGGTSVTWKVKYGRRDLTAYDDLDSVTYTRSNLITTATLGWGAYNVSDAITKAEMLANRGQEAIINTYDTMADSMTQDLEDGFNVKLYNGSGSGAHIVGIMNALRFNAASNTVEALVPKTSTNYATLPLDSTTPVGTTGDYWSPKGINAGYNSETWAATANKAISQMGFLIRKLQISAGRSDMRARPDLCILTPTQYDAFKLDVQKKGAIYITPGSTKLQAVEFGFDATPFNGVDVSYDDAIPSTDIDSQTVGGIILNFDYIELLSQQPTLFVATTHPEEARKSILFDIDFFGQLKVTCPRYQGAFLVD
jgi:hypothetical protein